MRPLDTSWLSTRSARWTGVAMLLFVPLLTVWNLAAASYAPHLQVLFGKPLRGVTAEEEPFEWSWRSLIDRDLQTAISDAVTHALPVRPFLIRLSNSYRKRLYGRYGAPDIVEGDDGHLFQQPYITEYCTRDLNVLEAEADRWIPRLREIQDFYESRGRRFLYLITPSKAAHLPEKFIDRIPCESSDEARLQYLPRYRAKLEAADIRFVDTATLVHSLRSRYDVELFPQGGTHWNALGTAHAADEILAELNRAAGKRIAPRLRWSYEITDRPEGIDTDLFDVVNLLFARPRYPTARVDFGNEPSCGDWPAAREKVALIGGSFLFGLAETLINPGCLRGLEGYNYLYRGKRTGRNYELVEERQTTQDLLILRDAEIVILEENEQLLPGSRHGMAFYRLVLGD